jgi:hypothetical protein
MWVGAGWSRSALRCIPVREVGEDPVDHARLGDEGDDPYRRSAVETQERVNLVDATDELCPAPPQSS